MKFYRIRSAVLIAAIIALPCAALAQATAGFPSKPVRVVIAQPPGGAIDIQARLFTAKMSENLGQQFIVDNRGGPAGVAGITAFKTVINAVPDGYTLLAVNPDFTFAPALYKNYPIDPIKDFAPVSLATRAPYLLVVNASTQTKSVKDLIALAHAQPGKLNFGAGNIGAGTHLSTMWFISAAKINATYVPYKGTGPALLDLMGANRCVADKCTKLGTSREIRKTARLGHQHSPALQSPARPADDSGAGRAGLQRVHFPWLPGAGAHTCGHH